MGLAAEGAVAAGPDSTHTVIMLQAKVLMLHLIERTASIGKPDISAELWQHGMGDYLVMVL